MTKFAIKKALTNSISALALGLTVSAGTGYALASPSGQKTQFGEAGKASEVTRVIEIGLEDNYFDPEEIKVQAGETIKFVIHNKGDALHEFNIGTPEMHAAHQKEMEKMMEMGMLNNDSDYADPAEMNHDMMKDMDHSMMKDMDHSAMEDMDHDNMDMSQMKMDGHGEESAHGEEDGHGSTAAHDDDGGMAHDDPNSILVKPGDTAELIWKFAEADNLEFGCNIPGHYESGMVGKFNFITGTTGS